MTLRIRTLLLVSLLIVGLFTLLFFALARIFEKNYADLETSQVQSKTLQVEYSVGVDLNSLERIASEWGHRDESIKVMLHSTTDILQDSLPDELFYEQNINVFLFINLRGEVIFSKGYNPNTQQVEPIPPSLPELIKLHTRFFAPQSIIEPQSNLLLLPEHILLYATHPIMETTNIDAPLGNILIGRFIDDYYIQNLSRSTQVKLDLYRYASGNLPGDVFTARSTLQTREQVLVLSIDKENIAGYTYLTDYNNRPAVLLKVQMSRALMTQMRLTLIYLGFSLLGTALLSILLISWILERLVLRRLSLMADEVRTIGTLQKPSFRVTRNGNDEIGQLAATINKSLDALDTAQNELIQSKERYRNLYLRTPAMLQSIDNEARLTSVSDYWLECMGYTYSEVLGRPISDFLTEESKRYSIEVVMPAYFRDGMVRNVPYQFITKDGSIIDTLISVVAERDEQGNIINSMAVVVDITDLKDAEARLRKAESNYRSLVENIPAITYIISADKAHTPLFFSPQFETLLGYTPETWFKLADPWQTIIHPEDRTFLEYEWDRANLTGRKIRLEYRLRTCNNGIIWVHDEAVLIKDDQNHPQYWQGVMFDITERKQIEQMEREQRELAEALRTTAETISTKTQLGEVIDYILANVGKVVPHDAATMMILEDDRAHMVRAHYTEDVVRNSQTAFPEVLYIHDVPNLLEIYESGESLIISDTLEYPGWITFPGSEWKRSYLGVPIRLKGRIAGFLSVYSRQPLFYNPGYARRLQAFADQAAIALDNANMFTNLQEAHHQLASAYEATIEGWARALEVRSSEIEGHSRRVTRLTMDLAHLLDFPNEHYEHIRRGVLLHDIGKLAVPDAILNKPGPLTDEEWVIMRRHPLIARDLLEPIEYLRPALEIPLYHHERWNGSGYPFQLRSQHIPLAARLFAVIDVWDALTSNRPYRAAWSEGKALSYLDEQSGTLFDPQVVKIFLEYIQKKSS